MTAIALASCLAGSQPTVTVSNSSVAAGRSITITSQTPVTWSLQGVGMLTNATSTQVTYTAPNSIVPQATILGCPATPNDSVFNTRADNLPTSGNSAQWISHSSNVPLTISPAWGISYADSTTPLTNWKPYYGNNTYDFSTIYPFPWPGRGPGLKRENGNYVGVTGYISSNDHHSVVVRRSDCQYFETYNDRINGETFTCADGKTIGCNVSSINVPYGFGSSSSNNGPYAMPYGTTDAAGLPLAPLSWHLDEIKAGAIKHAVRFTLSAGYINGSTWPATTANATSPNGAPYGARFLLKTKANGGPDPETVCLEASGSVNPDCVTMLTGLEQYGMMLADIGLNNEIETFSDLTEDATTRAAINLIQSAEIALSNFYVVDESSLRQTATGNFQTYANGSYSVNPNNGYVTPVSSAIVTATSSSGSIRTPIALQGTAVGLTSNELTIAAGMNGYQISSWVNPSSLNQAVSWSLVSGSGEVSSSGVYTPPSTSATGENAVLKVVAAADPSAVNYVYVKVLATNSTPSAGTIRIDSASESPTYDQNNVLWNSESGVEASLMTESILDYPYWPGLEGRQYGTQLYTRGGDIAYRLVVPNGNYKVRVMYGQIYNGNYASSPFAQTFVASPVFVETQGNIVSHYYDWDEAAQFRYQTPADAIVPATVTNNTLVIRAMVMTPDSPITAASGIGPLYPGKFPYLLTSADIKTSSINGIEVMPDTSAAHWAIDTQGATSIATGQSIQLYVVDWYSGMNNPTWSIVSGPSGTSISSTGLLTLSASAAPNSQPVVVKASNGSMSATATFTTSGTSASSAPITTTGSGSSSSTFKYVRAITISHTQVASAQTNFPLTLSFTDPTLRTASSGGHVQNQNGYDLVLSSNASGTSLLQWEVEQYNGTTGHWVAHVKIPTLSSTQDTVIYLLYGTSSITSLQSTASAVWDSNYQGVYHFASSSALMKDSTSGGHNGTATGLNYNSSGEIGGAANMTGGSATLPLSTFLQSNAGTIELWLNSSVPETSAYNSTLLQQDWFDGSANGFSLGWSGYSNDFEINWKVNGTNIKVSAPSYVMNLQPNTWNQLVYTWNRSASLQTLSVNGQFLGEFAQSFGSPSFASALSLSVPANPSYYGLSGSLDEVRFSTTVRSAAWISTSFNSQNAGATMANLGSEQSM